MKNNLIEMSFDVTCDCGHSFSIDGITLTTAVICPNCNADITVPDNIKQDYKKFAKVLKSSKKSLK